MATADEQIRSAAAAISGNIDSLGDQRDLLSQNVLAQLRNLVEGVAVCLHTGQVDAEFEFSAIEPALAFVRSNGRLNFLSKFHKLIQSIASHYTMDGDASERLMLKYYEYLVRIRSLLRRECGIDVLTNLEAFPVDLDPSLREYHDKIAERIESTRSAPTGSDGRGRYYIHKTRPFFSRGRIFYEVTFYPAVDQVSKFNRIIGFTDIDMTDEYAARLTLRRDSISVLGQSMPITIIRAWQVSIRPCEFNNFARLFGLGTRVQTGNSEYEYVMGRLTAGYGSLLDLIDLPDGEYAQERAAGTARVSKPQIFPALDAARRIVRSAAPGYNVIRYLMLRMRNWVLKAQYSPDPCGRLSQLYLKYGCVPFDKMPLCTSPPGHVPRFWDLLQCLDATGRKHELLARRVNSNVERRGMLYTPLTELEDFGDLSPLISTYNDKLYFKHREHRELMLDMGHVFIRGYEQGTVVIVEELQKLAASGVDGYTSAVQRWLDATPHSIDDEAKRDALTRLFSQSRVALIYGAAGTGKSTMVDHIANYFNDHRKLFLAHTNPAVDNLRRRVTAQQYSEFRTISSHISRRGYEPEWDLLVIDECSTVNNANFVKVLNKTSFKLLVLVGDVYQIESIQFGNWFGISRSFIPATSVFELITPYRTTNRALLSFWDKVRHLSDDLAEVMARHGYSSVLDETLFQAHSQNEIILCLNYDGLYGINNINRFLQAANPGEAVVLGPSLYKVGDPILFNETERFRPLIYNNLKGRIVGIERFFEEVQFDVELDRSIREYDVAGMDLEWLGGSNVRFSVYERDTSDEDDTPHDTTVPFQVAYAVSIHKAQGLEYDSVKIVITDANEDDITHSIFYTAVTRARQTLRIFWTPETQQAVLHGLQRTTNSKDVQLLSSRRGLIPINGSRRPA